MPSSNIHLKVAYELNKKLKLNSRSFFIGNISPDAVNLNGFAPKEKRWESHVRAKDLNVWRENVRLFFLENKEKYDTSFLLGYISHIITDIVHDEYLYSSQREKIVEDNNGDSSNAHEILRNDMEMYSFNELNEIFEIINSDNKSFDILNISKDLLSKWVDLVVHKYNNKTKSIYQTESDIEKLISIVEKELSIYLKSNY